MDLVVPLLMSLSVSGCSTDLTHHKTDLAEDRDLVSSPTSFDLSVLNEFRSLLNEKLKSSREELAYIETHKLNTAEIKDVLLNSIESRSSVDKISSTLRDLYFHEDGTYKDQRMHIFVNPAMETLSELREVLEEKHKLILAVGKAHFKRK